METEKSFVNDKKNEILRDLSLNDDLHHEIKYMIGNQTSNFIWRKQKLKEYQING